MNKYSAISFDLDNTLWPVEPSIIHAEDVLYNWLSVHYPKLTSQFSKEDIQVFREPILEMYKDKLHDLTFVRTALLLELAESVDYPESMAYEAMVIYREARNRVTYYADVMSAIEKLASCFTLIVITNGNAEIEKLLIRNGGSDFPEKLNVSEIFLNKSIFKSIPESNTAFLKFYFC